MVQVHKKIIKKPFGLQTRDEGGFAFLKTLQWQLFSNISGRSKIALGRLKEPRTPFWIDFTSIFAHFYTIFDDIGTILGRFCREVVAFFASKT